MNAPDKSLLEFVQEGYEIKAVVKTLETVGSGATYSLEYFLQKEGPLVVCRADPEFNPEPFCAELRGPS